MHLKGIGQDNVSLKTCWDSVRIWSPPLTLDQIIFLEKGIECSDRLHNQNSVEVRTTIVVDYHAFSLSLLKWKDNCLKKINSEEDLEHLFQKATWLLTTETGNKKWEQLQKRASEETNEALINYKKKNGFLPSQICGIDAWYKAYKTYLKHEQIMHSIQIKKYPKKELIEVLKKAKSLQLQYCNSPFFRTYPCDFSTPID